MFYITPFDNKFFDLKSLDYTECIDGSSIKDFEYDLVITRKGKISDDSIYILLDEKEAIIVLCQAIIIEL